MNYTRVFDDIEVSYYNDQINKDKKKEVLLDISNPTLSSTESINLFKSEFPEIEEPKCIIASDAIAQSTMHPRHSSEMNAKSDKLTYIIVNVPYNILEKVIDSKMVVDYEFGSTLHQI